MKREAQKNVGFLWKIFSYRRNMWGPRNPIISSVPVPFCWYRNDLNIDESFRILMIKRMLYTKIHFPQRKVVKNCFKWTGISKICKNFRWGSTFWMTKCRTSDISEFQNFEYQNNETWVFWFFIFEFIIFICLNYSNTRNTW